MLEIAICDDEDMERKQMKEWLTSYFLTHNLFCEFTEYSCGEELYADYDNQLVQFDLIFLDIYMDKMNGIETAQAIRGYAPQTAIVFLTKSPDYAVDGYAVDAIGYLLKPTTDEKLTALMRRLEPVLDKKAGTSLLIGGQTHSRRVPFAEICWLKGRNKKVEVHLADGTVSFIHERLSELELRLTAPCFLKCNRGIIVNMEYVTDASESFRMCDGSYLPIKVREQKKIKEQYFEYMIATNLHMRREANG